MAMRRFGDGGTTHPDLNSRAQQMVGRSAEIISVDGPGGQVRVDGMPWRAEWRLAEPAAGAHRPHPPRPGGRGRVVGTDGNRLFVEPQ
jgi:membrane protein implicated in regulation of membrane protease activity